MKTLKIFGIVMLFALSLQCAFGQAQEITFTNKTYTFTNWHGMGISKTVELTKATLNGLVWQSGTNKGILRYSDLPPSFIASLANPPPTPPNPPTPPKPKVVETPHWYYSWGTYRMEYGFEGPPIPPGTWVYDPHNPGIFDYHPQFYSGNQ